MTRDKPPACQVQTFAEHPVLCATPHPSLPLWQPHLVSRHPHTFLSVLSSFLHSQILRPTFSPHHFLRVHVFCLPKVTCRLTAAAAAAAEDETAWWRCTINSQVLLIAVVKQSAAPPHNSKLSLSHSQSSYSTRSIRSQAITAYPLIHNYFTYNRPGRLLY